MRIWVLWVAAMLLIACRHISSPKTGDAEFNALSESFLRGYLAWRPQMGVGLGLHEYDGKITDYSASSIAAELRRLKDFDAKLSALNTAKLSQRGHYDYRILRA